ncbi:MAG: class I SAM-dependent methyltransferase [Halobacteriota archaeon]
MTIGQSCQFLLNAIMRRDRTGLSLKLITGLVSFYDSKGKYVCPCCNNNLLTFRAYGKPRRPNAECPKCGSVERHRLLYLYLKNRTSLFFENVTVLQLAPEYCLGEILALAPNVQYVSADLCTAGECVWSTRSFGLELPLVMVKTDITELSFPNNCFDVILCLHVLEHIPNDTEAIKELFRVLKPGGWAIVQVPIDKTRNTTFEDPEIVSPTQREIAFGQHDHVRLYGLDYKDRLEKVGFLVKIDQYVKELPIETVKRCGLDYEEDIYLLTKPKQREPAYSSL